MPYTDKRKKKISQINEWFDSYATNIHSAAQQNDLSGAIYAENNIRDLLNLLLGLKLQNANSTFHNIPGIDLIDYEQKLCIQITAINKKSRKAKIKDSLQKTKRVIEDTTGWQYKIMFLCPEDDSINKLKKDSLLKDDELSFNPEVDILDFTWLVERIEDLPFEQLEPIYELCEKMFEEKGKRIRTLPIYLSLAVYGLVLLFLLLFVVFKSSPAPSLEEQLSRAEDYFLAQDYDQAAKLYWEIENESPIAQNNLAYLYENHYVASGSADKTPVFYYKKAAEDGDMKALRNYILISVRNKNSEDLMQAFQIAYKNKNQMCMEYAVCAGLNKKLNPLIRKEVQSGKYNHWFETFSQADAEQIFATIDDWHYVETNYSSFSSEAFTGEESKCLYMGASASYKGDEKGIIYKYDIYQRGSSYLSSLCQLSDSGFEFVADQAAGSSKIADSEDVVYESTERIVIDGMDATGLGYQNAENTQIHISGWVCPGESNIWNSDITLTRDGMETDDDLVKFRYDIKNISDETMKNLTIRCILPTGMEFISGSVKLANANHPEGTSIDDSLFEDQGANIGDYASESNAWIYFRARVKETELEDQSLILRTVFQASDGSGTIELPVDVLLPSSPYYIKVKSTQNKSDQWYESLEAAEHDLLSCQVAFDNKSGNTVENVIMKASIPYGFEYVPGSTELVSSATDRKPVTLDDGIAEDTGINIGNIGDANGVVFFQVRKTLDADACSEIPVEMNWGGETVMDRVLIYRKAPLS